MYLNFVVPLLVFAVRVRTEQCTTPNSEQGVCIALSSCAVLFEALQANPDASVEEFVEKSLCGGTKFLPKVCCGSSPNFTKPEMNDSKPDHKQNVTKENLLPSRKYCGLQHSDDYFRPENDTLIRITEFPWLARIQYRNKFDDTVGFKCIGSLINTKYILTSAYCVKDRENIPIKVRLGEFHTLNETDCVQEQAFDRECSSPTEDFGIEKAIIHPNYSLKNKTNDLGLLRLNRTASYSDYIRPICLPLPGTTFAKIGDLLVTSGWGKNHSAISTEYKKKIFSTLITNEECRTSFFNHGIPSPRLGLITENNLCTIQANSADEECQGDGGGPVMFSHRSQWHQEGIVSWGVRCGLSYPNVQTRVVNYLDWIIDSLEP